MIIWYAFKCIGHGNYQALSLILFSRLLEQSILIIQEFSMCINCIRYMEMQYNRRISGASIVKVLQFRLLTKYYREY